MWARGLANGTDGLVARPSSFPWARACLAARRPLAELRTVRTGANVGQLVATVKRGPRDRALRLGRERRTANLTAVWTGLRRGEVAALAWCDIDLDGSLPSIRLRAETTKSKRADVTALHPQLAGELRAFTPPTASPEHLVVSTVPSMKALRADLRLAEIDPGTRTTGFIDLHSLR